MTATYERPHYREIDTPWEPQPIAWRYKDPILELDPATWLSQNNRDTDTLLAQTKDPSLTHLVREVDVDTSLNQFSFERSVQDTMADLALVDQQFLQLELLTNIRVASTQWHAFKDGIGRTRTLARVRIIDGAGFSLRDPATYQNPSDIDPLFLTKFHNEIATYMSETIGRPLHDISRIHQYRFGIPRTFPPNPLAEQALYLVDIEPFLNSPNGDVAITS